MIPDRPKAPSNNINSQSGDNHVDEIVRCIPDSVVLSDSEKSLLSKGLNFVPTTSVADAFQNETDLQHFFRRLLLKAFFYGKENDHLDSSDDFSLFSKFHHKKSNFTPKASWFPILEKYFRACQNQIDNLNTKPLKRHNLTTEEQTALRHLKSRTDIVIKAATKVAPSLPGMLKAMSLKGIFNFQIPNFAKNSGQTLPKPTRKSSKTLSRHP